MASILASSGSGNGSSGLSRDATSVFTETTSADGFSGFGTTFHQSGSGANKEAKSSGEGSFNRYFAGAQPPLYPRIFIHNPYSPIKVIVKPQNTTSAILSINNSRLCGFVGFCDHSAYDDCKDTPINVCEKCSKVAAGSFLLYVVTIGVAIFVGNAIICAVGIYRHGKGKAVKTDVWRTSLALADFLTGVQVLVVAIINYSWSTSLTARELDREHLTLHGSVEAFFGATFYLFGYTSSVYHLLFVSLQRLYAIKKPILFKWQSKSTVYNGLALVWIFAIVSATIPAWFPKHFTYGYIAPAFLYLPVLKNISATPDYTPAIVILMVLFAIPYLITAGATISCGVLIWFEYRNKSQSLSERNRSSSGSLPRRKTKTFVTVAIMVLGFTITLIPVLIVTALLYANYLNCYNYSTPYLICIYLSLSNNFVNIIIYSMRDRAFRLSAKELFSALSSSTTNVQ